jgi:hypothetical protein
MGISSSTNRIKLPPVRIEEPYPTVDPIGIGKGMAQGCQHQGRVCQLAVASGVSASGAKLYRDMGTITRLKCNQFATDTDKVRNNQMAFEELRKGLLDGIYYRNLGRSNDGQEYCGQILFDAADLTGVKSPEGLPMDKARQPTIRKISDSGGFSSITKAFIKPSIPFEVEFLGKKHLMPVLTLMHPSPVRVENVQHDAMLTLGDPNDGNNTGLVILVPLVGSLMAGASGQFIAKVARYLSGILTPNPATGQYESIDIPTGSDWNLSSIFPGAPGPDGKTYVTNPGFYVWSGRPPLALARTRTEVNTARVGIFDLGDKEFYSWVPSGPTSTRYIMLSEPVQVNSMDLQTIRMLPSTPTTEALAPLEKTTLSYRTAGRVGPNGEWIPSCPSRPASTAALGASLFGGREPMENPKCDPFAPGNFPSKAPSQEEFVNIITGVLVTFGAILAIYFAVKLWTNPAYRYWFADKFEGVSNSIAQIFKQGQKLPPSGRFKPTPEDEAKAKEKAKEEQRKTYRSSAVAPTRRPAGESAAGTGLGLVPELAGDDAEAKRKAEEEAEAKRKAEEEEAIRKAGEEAEAKRKSEEEAIRKAGEEADAKRKAEEEAEAKRKADEEARQKAQFDEVMDAFRKAEADTSARERAEAEALVDTQPVDARRKRKTVVTAPKPPGIDFEGARQAREEAEIKRKAEEAAKSASASAERQSANVPKKRNVQSSDRNLLVAKETTVKPSTGETKTVEDPKKVLDAYAKAIQAYKASRDPKDYDAARKLESDARAVSLKSIPLKTRYQELVQDLVRHHEEYTAPPEKSPEELLSRLTKLEGDVKTEKASLERFSDSGPIVQERHEDRLTKALDLLANRLTYTNEQLKTMNAEPLKRLPVEKKVNQLLKLVKAEREAQTERRKVRRASPFQGHELDGKGRRRRMKRKSTRRYVA